MKKIIIGLLIGAVAGLVDIIPMVIMDLSLYANISAFVHWLVLGIVIPFISWDLYAWIKGSVIGILTAIPIIILTFEKDFSSIVPILVSSLILGAFVGLSGQRFVPNP